MSIIRAVKRSASSAMAHVAGAAGEASLRRAIRRARGPRPDRIVLIAAPGGGNLGDQAMLETFVDQTDGLPVTIVVSSRKSVTLDGSPAEVVELPSVTHGRGIGHVRDMARLGRLLASTSQVYLIGADVMDGAYSRHASVTRWRILRAAAEAGVSARVLGFSWNAHPSKTAAVEMRRASRAGVVMCARDPLSASRLRKDGSATVVEVADIVFLLERYRDDAPEVKLAQRLKAEHGKVALVNASGLVASKLNQVPAYKSTVEWLTQHGYAVILLPHVNRGERGDEWAISQVEAVLSEDARVERVGMLEPATIRSLTKVADLVITGRMHLAIMSLSNATPPVVIATQGKVRGLLSLFGLESASIEPDSDLEPALLSAVSAIDGSAVEVRESVATSLPSVKRLAEANFEALPTMAGRGI